MLIFILNTRDIMPDDSIVIDDGTVGKAAKDISTDITSFATNLSSADTTVQAALDTIDDAALGEANPAVVSQVDAEAGVSTTEKTWTAVRVKQAIAALGGGGGGGATRVEVTIVGNVTSTVTADTIYVWNDPDASQGFTLTLPACSAAGAGTRITCVIINGNGDSFTVKPQGSDVIYDHYEEANNSTEGIGTSGMYTPYPFFFIDLITDGAGFWWTIQGPDAYWGAV